MFAGVVKKPAGTEAETATATATKLATFMANKKIKGIYLRGNTFWLTHGSGKRRLQVSLETADYAEAVTKAQEILTQPLLNTTAGFKADLDDFADEQTKAGVWTKNSRKSKYSVLLMFGEDIDWSPLPGITTAKIQHWYDKQVKRISARWLRDIG